MHEHFLMENSPNFWFLGKPGPQIKCNYFSGIKFDRD